MLDHKAEHYFWMMDLGIDGRVAVVTGAGKGVAREVALPLLSSRQSEANRAASALRSILPIALRGMRSTSSTRSGTL
jgi:hypothetical protein